MIYVLNKFYKIAIYFCHHALIAGIMERIKFNDRSSPTLIVKVLEPKMFNKDSEA